jgi:putative colanic acid biosynthesis acetyltransferase WcaF
MKQSYYEPTIYQSHHSFNAAVYLLFWRVMRVLCFRFTPKRLNRIRITCLRMFGADVAGSAVIHPTCRIYSPRTLRLGERSYLAERIDCYSVAEIDIGADVTVSQDAFLCTASNDIDSPDCDLVTGPIRIEHGARVFARGIILPGFNLARGLIVAVGAVVYESVDRYLVLSGNPALVIPKRGFWPVRAGVKAT